MFLRNTSTYPDDQVRDLVELAFGRIDHRRVCVNVKGGQAIKGHAYNGVPDMSNAPATAEYLITLNLPTTIEPTVWNERRRGRWPVYRTADWREALVMLAAHEARHIEQFRDSGRASELSCERYARVMLGKYRARLLKPQEPQPDRRLTLS